MAEKIQTLAEKERTHDDLRPRDLDCLDAGDGRQRCRLGRSRYAARRPAHAESPEQQAGHGRFGAGTRHGVEGQPQETPQ